MMSMSMIRAILCIFLLLCPANGSLSFTGTTHRVNHGSAAALDNNGTWTMAWWFYPTSWAGGGAFSHKGADATGIQHFVIQTGSSEIQVTVDRNSGDATFVTNNASITTNKWWFLAVSFDVNEGTAGEAIDVYVGDLSTPATERTYATSTNGSGAVGNDASTDLFVGNLDIDAVNLNSRVAVVGRWSTVQTLAQIQAWQFRPRALSGMTIFSHYWNTGTVRDLSGGGNHGTVTGATVADHVPLGATFARAWQWIWERSYGHLGEHLGELAWL